MSYFAPSTLSHLTKIIEHSTGTAALRGDIYFYRIRDGAEISLEEAKEMVEIGSELTKDIRVGALVDARAHFTDTNEARQYFAENTQKNQFAAVAVITSSLAQRLIINFYINFNRPNVPTKMFGDEEEAMKWLRKILDKKLATDRADER